MAEKPRLLEVETAEAVVRINVNNIISITHNPGSAAILCVDKHLYKIVYSDENLNVDEFKIKLEECFDIF